MTFDGTKEVECAPIVPCGDEILIQLNRMSFGDERAGKKRKKKRKKGEVATDDNVVWKKKSIFFRLP
jgi:hypothetical protein